MNKTTEEHVFNPESMDVDDSDEQDLGDYEFEVDKLEAEAAAEEEPIEDGAPESDDDEPTAEVEDTEAEVEEEPDGETEAVAEDEPEEVEEADDLAVPEENPMIPRERLNAANRKRQEETDRAETALAKVAELEAQMATATEDAGMEAIDPAVLKEAAEKVLDGDTDAFSQVLAEQFNNMRQATSKSEAEILERATQNAVQVIEQNTRDTERQDAADEWVAVYPELDHESADVNQEALEEAIDIAGMYEQRGYRPGPAMERAVRAVAANHNLTSTQKVTALKTPKAKVVARKKAAPKDIAQPAPTGRGGAEKTATPKHNASEMSQDEWDALPESVRDEILTGTIG